ncbi:MAG: hypothetical protein RL662_1636 [Bacteroidota bacterium]|jgi:hypothetical protein
MRFIDYIKGLRKGKEAHRIELDAMNDPFLADAIEGYNSVAGDHAQRIVQMKAHIFARTTSGKKTHGAWKITIAASVLIASLGGYFALMNHESAMLTAQQQDNTFINLYIPEEYIINKSLELSEIKQSDPSGGVGATSIANISNLNEVIKPIERMTIYIPEAYAQLQKEEISELDQLKAIPKHTKPEPESVITNIELYNDNMLAAKVSSPITLVSKEANGVTDVKKNRYITGTVMDADNNPITGATIRVKGGNTATVTDIDGHYTLQVDADKNDLIANFIGFDSVEIPNAKDHQVIAMSQNNETLSEVVVVSGYGTQKRSTHKLSSKKTQPVIGYDSYYKYLKENAVKPVQSDCKKNKGKVSLEFIINALGRPTDIMVTKSFCTDFNNEAIRLIQNGCDWVYTTSRVKIDVDFQ